MTAKEYLSQARYLDIMINSKIRQIDDLNTLATNATSVITGMPGSPNKSSSRMADIIAKIVDLQAEINCDIDRLVDLKQEIRDVIAAVPDAEQRTILEQRYLCFEKMEQISLDIGRSIQHTYRLHDLALEEIVVPPQNENNVME